MAASLSGFGLTDRVRKILKPARIATALDGIRGGFCLWAVFLTLFTLLGQGIVCGPAWAQSYSPLGANSPVQAPAGKAPGQDQVQSAYQVTDVPVDATAANAAQAREQAISAGQVKALDMLFQRLVDPSQAAKIPHPSPAQVEQMVLGLSIRDEKTSAVRYLAKIDVSFMPQAVKAMMERAGISYVETSSKPTLVLPIWRTGADSAALLWEDSNPWRQAWAARRGGSLITTEVPLGDLTDLNTIDASRALSLEPTAMTALQHRYGAEGVLVAEAKAQKTSQSIASNPDLPGLAITVRRLSSVAEEPITLTVLPEPGEDAAKLLVRAVALTSQALDKGFKPLPVGGASSSMPEGAPALSADGAAMPPAVGGMVSSSYSAPSSSLGPTNDATVTLMFEGLNDWMALRQGLDQTSAIRRWSLKELRKTSATAALSYGGTLDELMTTLAAVGISVSMEQQGLTLRRAPIAAIAPAAGAPGAPGAPGASGTPGTVAPAAGYPASQSSVTIR